MDDLENWGDPSSARNMAYPLLDHRAWIVSECEATTAIVSKSAMWARHIQALTRVHLLEILSHLTTLRELWVCLFSVDFNDEIDEGLILDLRDRGVLSIDFLTINFSMEHYMLTNW